MMSPMALAYLLVSCAPNAHPETLAAIVAHESGGYPFAIHDNSPSPGYPRGRAYFPATYDDAVVQADELLAEGHESLDLGLGQVNSSNFAGLHRAGFLAGSNRDEWVGNIFKPGANIRAADYILSSAWNTAERYFGVAYAAAHPHDVVLNAISDYNSNSLFAAKGYVASVVAQVNSDYVTGTVHAAYALVQAGLVQPNSCDTESLDPLAVAAAARQERLTAQARQIAPAPSATAWFTAWVRGSVPAPTPTPIVKFSYHPIPEKTP